MYECPRPHEEVPPSPQFAKHRAFFETYDDDGIYMYISDSDE